MSIDFKEAKNRSDLDPIETMAKIIWHEHYTPIIGKEQVLYMLDKFQSTNSMFKQVEQGYRYFSIYENKKMLGYLSFEKRVETLFLSKIYLKKEFRGKGRGKEALNFVMQKAGELGCQKVSLTVNRFNLDSIKAYEKAGFINIGETVQDIGEGFIMDDYLMEKMI